MTATTPEDEAARLLEQAWECDEQGHTILPVDPVAIASQLGIDVFPSELAPDIAGVLVSRSDRDPLMILNQSDSPVRQRFTCAHEIGHFIRNATKEPYERVDYRNNLAGQGVDDEEIFANQFAAALLMPADLIRERRIGGATPASMAVEFGVSLQAMSFRITNLGA